MNRYRTTNCFGPDVLATEKRGRELIRANGGFVANEDSDDGGKWVTVNGTHIHLNAGESAADAIKKKFTGKDEYPPITSIQKKLESDDHRKVWEAWKESRDRPGEAEAWVFADQYEPGEKGFFKKFKSAEQFQKWKQDVESDGVQVSDRAMPEKTFYRTGKPPESFNSYNRVAQKSEMGVSAYHNPESTSFAGSAGNNWYSGKGRQVGIGSDGEPVVIPTEKWKPYLPEAKRIKPA